ncbi:MAG: hypothetical protein GY930_06175 [bacterium]|nr:hypothetical protein [bacterium]
MSNPSFAAMDGFLGEEPCGALRKTFQSMDSHPVRRTASAWKLDNSVPLFGSPRLHGPQPKHAR